MVDAVDQARRINDRVGELSKAAARIGDVVDLINPPDRNDLPGSVLSSMRLPTIVNCLVCCSSFFREIHALLASEAGKRNQILMNRCVEGIAPLPNKNRFPCF